MKNKGNAKSLYSKNQILTALLQLMQQKPFNEITIKEIAENALITRKTFYRNFDKKIDVLNLEINKVIHTYLEAVENATDLSLANVAYLVFKTMEKHRSFIQLLVENNLNYLLINKMFKQIMIVYKIRKKELFDLYGEKTVSQTLMFSFGGFEKYISYWIMSDEQVTTTQLKKDFKQISYLISESI